MREAHFAAESKDPIPAEAVTNPSGEFSSCTRTFSGTTHIMRGENSLTRLCLLRSYKGSFDYASRFAFANRLGQFRVKSMPVTRRQ
jgi:hypothetical protein